MRRSVVIRSAAQETQALLRTSPCSQVQFLPWTYWEADSCYELADLCRGSTSKSASRGCTGSSCRARIPFPQALIAKLQCVLPFSVCTAPFLPPHPHTSLAGMGQSAAPLPPSPPKHHPLLPSTSAYPRALLSHCTHLPPTHLTSPPPAPRHPQQRTCRPCRPGSSFRVPSVP